MVQETISQPLWRRLLRRVGAYLGAAALTGVVGGLLLAVPMAFGDYGIVGVDETTRRLALRDIAFGWVAMVVFTVVYGLFPALGLSGMTWRWGRLSPRHWYLSAAGLAVIPVLIGVAQLVLTNPGQASFGFVLPALVAYGAAGALGAHLFRRFSLQSSHPVKEAPACSKKS